MVKVSEKNQCWKIFARTSLIALRHEINTQHTFPTYFKVGVLGEIDVTLSTIVFLYFVSMDQTIAMHMDKSLRSLGF